MTRKSGRPPRNDDPDKPDHPPAGAALDRYEASVMLMIASRALEAYDHDPSLPRQRRRSRKPKKH
jgi:hypothetical protein